MPMGGEVADRLNTTKYLDLAQLWQQRAKGCTDGEERALFLTIAHGYEQLAKLSRNSDATGEALDHAM